MIVHQGKRYNQVRVLNPTPLDVNINGTTVVNNTLTDVNLTLVDQNGDDLPFTQTGTELKVDTAFDLEIKVNGIVQQTINLNPQENNVVNIIL